MFLKKRIIATAAVIAMAAAAVYGSTQEMSQTQESGKRTAAVSRKGDNLLLVFR